MKPSARELFAIDLRSLAAFRVAIGCVLLVDLAIRATDLGAMYTDDGMFSRALICRHFSIWSWSFHFGGGSLWYQAVLFSCAAAFAASLLVGYQTRLVAVASWLMLISLHNRVPHILSGADNLARMLLFWGMFLPLGGVWSVDARLAGRRGASVDSARSPGSVASIASAGILLQMAFMYLFSAVFKSNADWLQGDAIAAILPDGFYGKPIAAWLLELPGVLAFLTIGILALEWLGPLLLFSPVRAGSVRLWVVGLLAAMHLGIAVLLHVGLFSLVSLSGLVLFLPPSFWERLRGRSPGESGGARSFEPGAERSPAVAPASLSFAARGACSLALVFVLFANVNGLPARFLPWTPLPKVELLTVALGLGQKWDMFAEAPPRNGWWVARATLVDGASVDLLRGGAPVDWARPEDPAGAYPNHRWRKCFREMSYTDARGYQVFRRPVAEYLCREWNREEPPARRIADFALVFCAERSDDPGLDPFPAVLRETLAHLDFATRDEAR